MCWHLLLHKLFSDVVLRLWQDIQRPSWENAFLPPEFVSSVLTLSSTIRVHTKAQIRRMLCSTEVKFVLRGKSIKRPYERRGEYTAWTNILNEITFFCVALDGWVSFPSILKINFTLILVSAISCKLRWVLLDFSMQSATCQAGSAIYTVAWRRKNSDKRSRAAEDLKFTQ